MTSPAWITPKCPPPLESGDVLSRDEFERIYWQHPEIKKAELIQGVVYVGSPVVEPEHGAPDNVLSTWLGNYAITHPGVRAANNTTVLLAEDDEAQPDVVLRRVDGLAPVNDRGFIEGSPELVAEIAASSANIAMHRKKESYRRAGVQEYIVWLTRQGLFHWFRLRDGEYVALDPDANGVIESEVFPGLRMDVPRLLAGDTSVALPGPSWSQGPSDVRPKRATILRAASFAGKSAVSIRKNSSG
jgi:Uma2 family endonuclease